MSIHKRFRLRRHAPRLFFELVVIILGITISLWFQDWREARADAREEERLLASFATELRVDLEELRTRAEILQNGIALIQDAVGSKQAARGGTDSAKAALDQVMDSALGYMSFSPSAATYLELRQTGASRIIRDKELLRSLIDLYERLYPRSEEWDHINRTFVLDRMFPYIDANGPAFMNSIDGAFAHGYHEVFLALQDDTQFRNLARTCVLFKEGQRVVYQMLVEALEKMLARLEEST